MAYKEKDTKKWTAQWFETNAKGEKKKRRKRGFETKREALEYERQKKLNSSRSMDMKLSEFMEVYFEDKQNELKERTMKNNYHIHLIFSERKLLDEPVEKIATRNMFYDENGKHVRTKKEILDEAGLLRKGCKIIHKGEVYERNLFTIKDSRFKSDSFLDEVKRS